MIETISHRILAIWKYFFLSLPNYGSNSHVKQKPMNLVLTCSFKCIVSTIEFCSHGDDAARNEIKKNELVCSRCTIYCVYEWTLDLCLKTKIQIQKHQSHKHEHSTSNGKIKFVFMKVLVHIWILLHRNRKNVKN